MNFDPNVYYKTPIYFKEGVKTQLPEHLSYLNVTDIMFLFSNLHLNYRFEEFKFEIHDFSESLQWVYLIYGDRVLKIKHSFFNTFVITLVKGSKEGTTFDEKAYELLIDNFEDPKKDTIYVSPYSGIPFDYNPNIPDLDNESVIGEHFTLIDKKIDKLFNLIENEVKGLSTALFHVDEMFNKDGTKVKDFDAILTFNTLNHKDDTRFFLALDKIPPIHTKDTLKLERRPLSDEDRSFLFGYPTKEYTKIVEADFKNKKVLDETNVKPVTYADNIQRYLDNINKGIVELFNNEIVISAPTLYKYAQNRFDSVIIPIVMQIDIRPYCVFGGRDNFKANNDEPSENVLACNVYLDQEIMKIINWLNTLPKEEGVDHFAIDADGMGVYGMNEDNIPISTITNPKYQFRNVFQKFYSNGFTELMKFKIKESKAKYFFTHKGMVIHKQVPTEVANITDVTTE